MSSRVRFKAGNKPLKKYLRPNNCIFEESDTMQTSIRSYLSPRPSKLRSISEITTADTHQKPNITPTEEEVHDPAGSNKE